MPGWPPTLPPVDPGAADYGDYAMRGRMQGANPVRQCWSEARCVTACWLGLADPLVGDFAAGAGFDAAVIDMQHGLLTQEQALGLLRGVQRHRGGPRCGAIVRVPDDNAAGIGKALDQGADGIIVPLVNSAAEARLIVAACHWPPNGCRSWGPSRALLCGGGVSAGPAYMQATMDKAEGTRPVVLVMIETAEGLADIENICAVPLLDGIFVGPSDLSIALGEPLQGGQGQKVQEALRRVLRVCRRHKKKVGIYSGTPGEARQWRELGFDLVIAADVVSACKQALCSAAQQAGCPSPALAAPAPPAAAGPDSGEPPPAPASEVPLAEMADADFDREFREARQVYAELKAERDRRRAEQQQQQQPSGSPPPPPTSATPPRKRPRSARVSR
eukprot:TRINITY_DN6590_c3_g1_i1.p2 TRINITY_DN6590_c3_g1~~TRINITY_DN6590_c3_g1_i1.p2  ORF type:complete len:388 (+),score=132.70 TRINITY_DN6590_c3_g1_i1:94-1257(+)